MSNAAEEMIQLQREPKPPYTMWATVCLGPIKTKDMARLEGTLDPQLRARELVLIIEKQYNCSRGAIEAEA